MRTQRIAAAILAIFALTAGALPQQRLAATETTALERLKYALDVSAANKDRIWPTFNLADYCFALSNPETGAYLIGFREAPDGATQVVSELFHDPVYFTKDSRALSANTATLLAGHSTAVIQMGELNTSTEQAVALIFHEAFHAFEDDHRRAGAKWRREMTSLVTEYPEESARNNALFRIEGELLFAALQTRDVTELRKIAREFIAVRKLRQRELEPRFVEFEKGTESNEGLADYAGLRAVELAAGTSPGSGALQAGGGVSPDYAMKTLESLKTITTAGRNIRLRFYSTGCAQAFLLDRLMPDWKARVQQDAAALQSLIEEATQVSDVAAPPIAETSLRTHHFDEILKEEEATQARKESARQALLNSILNQSGQRYVIDFSGTGEMGQITSFDPMNITPVGKLKRIHTRMLNLGEKGQYQAEFNQPVIEDDENRQYITVSAADQNQVLADGVPLDLTKPLQRHFKNLVIKTPKFEFKGADGVIVIGESDIRVKLGKAQSSDLTSPAVSPITPPKDAGGKSTLVSNEVLTLGLEDTKGKVHKLNEYLGKQIYLLFICAQNWAKPAHHYFDALNSLDERQYKFRNNAMLIVVASQNSSEQVKEFLASRSARFPIWIDSERELAFYFNPNPAEGVQFPFIIGIDPRGHRDFVQTAFTGGNVESFKKLLFEK